MQAFMKKIGYFALVLGGLAMAFSATGCTNGHGLVRPGWIFPTR